MSARKIKPNFRVMSIIKPILPLLFRGVEDKEPESHTGLSMD